MKRQGGGRKTTTNLTTEVISLIRGLLRDTLTEVGMCFFKRYPKAISEPEGKNQSKDSGKGNPEDFYKRDSRRKM